MSMSPDPIDVEVGARIRAQRADARMSQQALADRLGVSFQQVQKYERGVNRISASMATRAAEAMGCKISELFPASASSETRSDVPDAIKAAYVVMGRPGGEVLLKVLQQLPDWAFKIVEDVALGLYAGPRGRSE